MDDNLCTSISIRETFVIPLIFSGAFSMLCSSLAKKEDPIAFPIVTSLHDYGTRTEEEWTFNTGSVVFRTQILLDIDDN